MLAANAAEPWDTPFSGDAAAVLKRASQISADNEADVQVLLEEHRVTLDASRRARSTLRKVYRILKDDGVEDWAVVEQAYQPWREQKPVIRARVITKSGTVHPLDEKTIADAPEQQFDNSTFSDTRVVRAPLPAVEVGAVVEYEITSDSGPAFPESGVTRRLVVLDTVPIERFRVTIDAANGVPLQTVYRHIPESAVRRTNPKGTTHIECELGPIPPRKEFEGGLPPDASIYPYFGFSTAASWQGIAVRYAEIVERQIQSADVKSLVGEVPSGATTIEIAGRLATELHRNIRYTGVEFGEAAIIPARPADVLQRKFGDCKDKSALLVAMLRAAGLKAHVALLRSGYGTDVEEGLPGLDLFDHAIVYVDGPQPLWMDATASHARAGILPVEDQGRLALIATKETTGLVKIPEQKGALNRNVFEIRFKDYGAGTIIETMESSGSSEMYLRSAYAANDNAKAALERYVKSAYLAKALGTFDLAGKDDLTKSVRITVEARDTPQVMTTTESAQVMLGARLLTSRLPYEVHPADNREEKFSSKNRANDYMFPEAGVWQHVHKLYPPALFRVANLPQTSNVNLGPLKLTRSYKKSDGGAVEVQYTLEIPSRRITAAEFERLRADLEKYEPQLNDQVTFVPETAELLAIGQTAKALAQIRENIAKRPNEAAAHMRLSRVLVSVGLGLPARMAAQKATEVEPKSSQAWQTLAWAFQNDSFGRLRQGDWSQAEAMKALRKAIELDGDDSIAKADLAILLEYNAQGERYGTGSNLKEAIALLREILKKQPNPVLQINLAADLFYDGQLDAAAEEARKCQDSERVLFEGLIRALREGAGPAIVGLQSVVLDPTSRTQQLARMAFTFLQMRRYTEALLFMQAAGRASNQSQLAGLIQLLGRLKRVEEADFAASDPRSVVQKFLLRMLLDPDISRQKLNEFWMHLPEGNSFEEDVRSIRASALAGFRRLGQFGLHTANYADMVLSELKFEQEGDDSRGYRITSTGRISGFGAGGGIGTVFVVRDGASFKILDSADDGGVIGRRVLDLLKQKKFEDARWWLDQAVQEMGHGKDGWLPAARGLWSGKVAATRGPDAIQVAAASLIGRAHGSADAIAMLNAAYLKAITPIDKGQINLALCESYSKVARWTDLAAAAKRLRLSTTFDNAGYQYLMKALHGSKNWKGLEAAALAETKAKVAAKDAWQYVAIARMRMGDGSGAQQAIEKYKEFAGSDGLELELWNRVLQKTVSEASFEAVQKREGPDHVRDRSLAALVYLGLKKPQEAHDALKESVEDADPASLDARAWVVYGGICDQYGFSDSAAKAWELARAAKVATREAEWALATISRE